MKHKEYRKRINELADKMNDETPYEVMITTTKEMIAISIHTESYVPNQPFVAKHYNFISLTNDSAKTIENEITILENVLPTRQEGKRGSGVTYRDDAEHGIIGICDICGNEIYNSDNYDYNGVYSMVHNACKREKFRAFMNQYNNRTGHEPKRFRIVRY